jgi:hypothetical protein
MEVSGQVHSPVALPGGNCPRYPLDGRLVGPQSRSGRCAGKKNLDPAENRTPATQPLARRYTNSLHKHRRTDDTPKTVFPYPWMIKIQFINLSESRGRFFQRHNAFSYELRM